MEYQFEEIRRIIVRVCLGENTEEERNLLDKWLRESKSHEDFYQRVCKPENLELQLRKQAQLDIEEAMCRNQRMLKRRVFSRMIYKTLPYAALVILVVGVYWMLKPGQADSSALLTKEALVPGTKQAELFLADGSSLRLVPGMKKRWQEGATEISITENNINYSSVEGAAAEGNNRIQTPLGGEYAVTLSDGTKVLLNAMSELIYPVRFQGGERRVILKGEAYFKVKRDTCRPFFVEFGDYQVKVLGTQFNIKAYQEEADFQTTLCSGCVSLTHRMYGDSVLLIPGKQALCNRDSHHIEIKEVDTGLYTAWTKGEFAFDNASIEEIFNVLQRWYKIEVFYENKTVRDQLFTGKLPRFDNLQVILDIMEKVSDVRFEVKGGTLLIR